MYAREGEGDKAISDYDESIRLDPKFADACRAVALSTRAWVNRTRLSPTTPRPFDSIRTSRRGTGYRGIAYRAKGSYDKAIADYTQVIRLDPNDAKGYSNCASAYTAKRDLDAAVADLTRAIRWIPGLRTHLIIVASSMRQEAITKRRSRTSRKPSVSTREMRGPMVVAVGLSCVRMTPISQSSTSIRQSTSTRNLPQRTICAVFYQKRGDWDKAIADHTKAIRLEPKDARAYYSRGLTYAKKGDYDAAIADSTEAIRLNPNLRAAFGNRGTAYRKKREYDKAIADYSDVIRLAPNDAQAYYNRGLAYAAKGDDDNAIADHTKAIRLEPKDARAYYSRGLTYAKKGDYDAAIADSTEAIRLNPNLRAAFGNRGRRIGKARV